MFSKFDVRHPCHCRVSANGLDVKPIHGNPLVYQCGSGRAFPFGTMIRLLLLTLILASHTAFASAAPGCVKLCEPPNADALRLPDGGFNYSQYPDGGYRSPKYCNTCTPSTGCSSGAGATLAMTALGCVAVAFCRRRNP